MAGVKDKTITVESLSALHEYNKETYVNKSDVISIANGGTNATDGATGLANLFASGNTVLSSYQYGNKLPEAGTVGRIFFKRLIDNDEILRKYDVNGDGVVNSEDNDIVFYHVSELELITDEEILARADINGDGVVNEDDAQEIDDYLNSLN